MAGRSRENGRFPVDNQIIYIIMITVYIKPFLPALHAFSCSALAIYLVGSDICSRLYNNVS